jgi:predicted kinase
MNSDPEASSRLARFPRAGAAGVLAGARPFIVVSGLPASGKTTLAGGVAQALGLPLFDKDDILEALFQQAGAADASARQRLSRMSDDVLASIAAASQGGVIVSFWRHEGAGEASGTPVAWLRTLGAALVEIHCVCPPGVAAQRFRARQRHPGHHDVARSAGLDNQLLKLAELGPLGLGKTITVRTDQPYVTGHIVDELRRHFAGSQVIT